MLMRDLFAVVLQLLSVRLTFQWPYYRPVTVLCLNDCTRRRTFWQSSKGIILGFQPNRRSKITMGAPLAEALGLNTRDWKSLRFLTETAA